MAAASEEDLQLVAALRAGDEDAFMGLVERHQAQMVRIAQMYVPTRAVAEEVVQETFMAVFRSMDAYRGQSTLLSWIYGIAKNTVNNYIRRARAHEQRVERAESELVRSAHTLDACTPEEHLSLRRYQDAIQERLKSVPEWHHEVFVLRHVDNLPIGEIARRVSAFATEKPEIAREIIRCGIGDVTEPLPPSAVKVRTAPSVTSWPQV